MSGSKMVVKVDDLKIKAKRGWYEKEKEILQEFRISVELEMNAHHFLEDPHLDNVIDYVKIMEVASSTFEEPFDLLETYLDLLQKALKKAFPAITKSSLKVKKHPSVPFDFDHVSVSLNTNYTS